MSEKILNGFLEEFKLLAAIPRQSKHEEKVSNFLKNYLAEMGFEVEQDAANNLIALIPATCGLENAPTTILQAHLDMVCVAEKGVNYNPLTDPIKLVITEEFMTADGTSLGADNGVGVAEALYIAKNHETFKHGAIKIIFTTDEEAGMSGAINLDAKHLAADFLINCDSEVWDEIVVGSAGSLRFNFSRKINFVAPEFKNAFTVKISGLKGGHSGIEIGANRANALKSMKSFLHEVESFQLANFSGGEAPNVISSSAEVYFVTDLAEEKIFACAETFKTKFKNIFAGSEPNFKIEIAPAEMPKKVFCEKDNADLLNLLELIHSGVFTMNREIPDQVESSANLAIVGLSGDDLSVTVFSRSNVFENLHKFIKLNKTLAKVTDFEMNHTTPSPSWNFNPDSRLTKIVSEVFQAQNGYAPSVHITHAGLECNYFVEKNPALDVVSIGTTNDFIHSPKERLHLKTVAPQINLVIGTLEKISTLTK